MASTRQRRQVTGPALAERRCAPLHGAAKTGHAVAARAAARAARPPAASSAGALAADVRGRLPPCQALLLKPRHQRLQPALVRHWLLGGQARDRCERLQGQVQGRLRPVLLQPDAKYHAETVLHVHQRPAVLPTVQLRGREGVRAGL